MESNTIAHDLIDFMKSITSQISDEYYRIQKHAKEDPGTAGDQGENTWAELLRDWLPPTLTVVTKGRILNEQGFSSPQVDIILLDATYPRKLQNQKYYLAAGVVAAFECKMTLRREHIFKATENSVKIKRLWKPRGGSLYKELYSPPVFGLFAHSYSWVRDRATGNVDYMLDEASREHITHPREMLDLVCVADIGSWTSWKDCIASRQIVRTAYLRHSDLTYSDEGPTPVGDMLARLIARLGWEDASIRKLAVYFRNVPGLSGRTGGGLGREWSLDILSSAVKEKLMAEVNYSNNNWDEWNPRMDFTP